MRKLTSDAEYKFVVTTTCQRVAEGCRGGLSHVIFVLTICQQAQDNKREQRLDGAHGKEERLS